MKRKDMFARTADASGKGNLRFVSTNTLEKELDGSESTFNDYFFAIYRCSPKDNVGIKELREQISNQYPNNAMSVGDDFVLVGEAAYLSLSTYYKALIKSSGIRGGW